MFPHSLAEGPFSLRAGVGPGAAMSIGVVLAADGAVESYAVTPSLVAPAQRLTYHEADARLAAGDAAAAAHPELHALAEVRPSRCIDSLSESRAQASIGCSADIPAEQLAYQQAHSRLAAGGGGATSVVRQCCC